MLQTTRILSVSVKARESFLTFKKDNIYIVAESQDEACIVGNMCLVVEYFDDNQSLTIINNYFSFKDERFHQGVDAKSS